MRYYLRHEYEETVEEAIKNHNYRDGFESVEHCMTNVFPGEGYFIYVRDYVGEIPEIYKNDCYEVDGMKYQLISAGVKECKT